MAASSNNPLRDSILPATLLIGDTLVAFAGLSLAYWLRYDSAFAALGIDVPWATYGQYLPLLLVGVIFLVAAFAQRGLYDGRMLLRKQHALNLLARATVYWVVVYMAFSLVIKFDPPISRLFVVFGGFSTLLLLWLWRELFYRVTTHPRWLPKIQRRVALLGWNESAETLLNDIPPGGSHPYQLVGCVTDDTTALSLRTLGPVKNLAAILRSEKIDVLLATRLDFDPDELAEITSTCEQAYAEWKVMPAAFPIFLSGLRLQTVGSVPVVGVEDLAISRLMNRMVKRLLDVIGATVGLVVSAPVIGVLAWLIRRESPHGSVLFRQTRVGADHQEFTLYKLRSMRPDADANDADNQSTRVGDTRLLRIGAIMRRWNLDELPQYWNVLRGQMSLVGPRPERPHHVDHLAKRIPHYMPRHLVKPGMTGWAQINGLRGATDLEERIRYDIYYIENWSHWLDLQIIGLTFLRWKSGAA
ncbi:sugar transferase [Synoicihabitans lomoniglobus]|uniref:Sugar transferase n=1 Tax=Synoicihabitans lomoniglobus TaxID=2909285 RepID=A0AAF0I5C0_9BACT|nr:sugar transferase [Opitutaceae bacterium LMO-M01]WED67273.1 sugar transferase [Opitutaceae bacterium LMO-M01]